MTRVSTPAVFLTRIIHLGGNLYGAQAFKSNDPRKANDPTQWENLMLGTQEECTNYCANLHHAIDPNMAKRFDPTKDVKRVLQ